MNKRGKYICLLFFIMVNTVFLYGCDFSTAVQGSDLVLLSPGETYEKSQSVYYLTVEDKDTLYEQQHEVRVLYLTVGQGLSEDGTNHTFEELNDTDLQWLQQQGQKPYQCEAVVQFGNEQGPVSGQFGYGVYSANATVELYGLKASGKPQKSYKLKIKEGEGNVEGMKTLLLSKSFSDPFRFTNKLCYELMQEIPQMMSTRTSFVHLYIKDVTERWDTKFVDYGLYTMVEPVNKKYLENRGLDKSGELYKAVDFDWKRHEDIIMQPTDGRFKKDAFEQILESKGSNDYSKLIALLDAVNDYSVPIEEIVWKYFDEENLYTFMAFQILVDNQDTDTENYYIYSPTGNDKFYFISWDNDAAFRQDYELLKDSTYDPGCERGAFLFRKSVLFNRILRDQKCVNRLTEKVYWLHESILCPENVKNKADELAAVAKEYIYSLPDRSFARVTSANYDMLLNKLAEQVNRNYYAYYDAIEGPWPFQIYEPERKEGGIILTWEESYALGMNVTYEVMVAKDWEFTKPIISKKGVEKPLLEIGDLEPGQYFVKIYAVSEDGHKMGAVEYYNSEKKTKVNHTLCFYVFEDGSVAESRFN